MIRLFEKVTGFDDVNIPTRATKFAAGYDFEAAQDIEIPSLFNGLNQIRDHIEFAGSKIEGASFTDEQFRVFQELEKRAELLASPFQPATQQDLITLYQTMDDVIDTDGFSILEGLAEFKKYFKPVLVPTGIKVRLPYDEMLLLFNRSSNPLKRSLVLANGVGVIDADYYNNEDNEGHIMFQFLNFGYENIEIKKGERIGQGVFQKYLLAANDEFSGEKRTGGFGSTNKNELPNFVESGR